MIIDEYVIWDAFEREALSEEQYRNIIKRNPTAPPERFSKIIKGVVAGLYGERWLVRDADGKSKRAMIYFNLHAASMFKLGKAAYYALQRESIFKEDDVVPIRVIEYVMPPGKWEPYFEAANREREL